MDGNNSETSDEGNETIGSIVFDDDVQPLNPPLRPLPPVPVFQQPADEIRQAVHAGERQLVHDNHQSVVDANLLTVSYMYMAEFMGYPARQIRNRNQNMLLTDEHTRLMRMRYGNDPLLAAEKFKVLAHLQSAAEVAFFSRYTTVRKLNEVVFDTEKKQYELFMGNVEAFSYGMQVVVCRQKDFLSGRDFQWYMGTVYNKRSVLALSVSHNDRDARFLKDQEVRLLWPPSFKLFEGYMLVIEALKNDDIFRKKFFPQAPLDLSPLPYPTVVQRQHPLFQDLNDEQFNVVNAGVAQDPRYPMNVGGPPGTGKTVVAAKVIVAAHEAPVNGSIGSLQSKNKFLIVTPSNAAANVITMKMLEYGLPPTKILRAYAKSVVTATVPPEIRHVAFFNEETFKYGYPDDIKLLREYDFIVCTIAFSVQLRDLGRTHFSYIIIDEAGQSLDMETLIPCVLFSNEHTRVILFGDSQQLRPFFVDGVIGQENFDASRTMLDRLAENPAYRLHQKLNFPLRYNYRSCNRIVNCFSALFYNNLVLPFSNPYNTALDLYCNHPILVPQQPIPIRFHVIRGQEQRVFLLNDHVTYLNNDEVNMLCLYVRDCIDKRGIQEQDIGIVAPYRGQIELIKRRLQAYPGILIDSVDRFQGSERDIIFITTVRSERIGFLADYRRLNVAISRPKRLLVLFGNLDLLVNDVYWRRYTRMLAFMRCILDGQVQGVNGPATMEAMGQHWMNRIDEIGR